MNFKFQVPSRVEPVLADKEVLLTALNVKAMTFGINDSDSEDDDDDDQDGNGNNANGDIRKSNSDSKCITYSWNG